MGMMGIERGWVFGLVLLGLVLRVVYVLQMQAHPNHLEPVMDSAYHVDWARSLAAGETFAPLADTPFFRAPLYVWFLAGVFSLFGDGLLLPRLIQCLFGAVTVGLVYGVGRAAFDARAARIAAAIAATYWVLIYYDGELLIPSLIVPLDLLALWLTLRLAHDASPRRAVLAGIVWGLSAIARPNVLLFMPLVALWLLWRKRPRWRAGVVTAAIFSAALLAPIAPITAYNTFAKGDFVLISSQGGVNFWIGNNPHSNGIFAIVPGTREGWWTGYYDSIAQAEQAEGRTLRASEVSQHYASRAWAFILGDPARSIPLLWRKVKLFFTAFEYGNNENITFFAHRFSVIPRLSIGFGVLAPLGLLGFFLALRRGSELFPLWGFLIVYTASVVAFFVAARFRVPVLPVLMIFAGHALVWLWDRIRARELLAASIAASFVLGFAAWSVSRSPTRAETEGSGYLQLALAEARRGGIEDAVPYLRRAHALSPNQISVLVKLATAELVLGNQAAAVRLFERALELDPLRTEALDGLLDFHYRKGRFEQIERLTSDYLAWLERAGVAQQPETPWFHLGRARGARGDVAGAVRALEEAFARDRRSLRAVVLLGDLHREGERWSQAEAVFRSGVETVQGTRDTESSPYEARIYQGLASSLWRQGKRDQACGIANAYRVRRPGEAQAVRLQQQACAEKPGR